MAKSKEKAAPADKTNDDEGSGLGTVLVRNEFYRDGYRSLLRLTTIMGIIIIGLILAMHATIQLSEPENRYFATTSDGRLVPMVPLSQPNLSTPALTSWAAQAATEVMTFNFNDYRRRLQESSRNFTRKGWESFTVALQNSRTIDAVLENQQIVFAAPEGAPILLSEGIINGRYQWDVQLPMVITYQSGARKRNDKLFVNLKIVRVPRLESPNGVGIEQWIAVPR